MEVTPVDLAHKSPPPEDMPVETTSAQLSPEPQVNADEEPEQPSSELAFEPELKYDPTQDEPDSDDSYEPGVDPSFVPAAPESEKKSEPEPQPEPSAPEPVENDQNASENDHEPAEDEDDDDDYDPEQSLSTSLPKEQSRPESLPKVPGLPPKPNVAALPANPSNRTSQDSVEQQQKQLKAAYDAILESELVKDPNFQSLPEAEQMQLIMKQLEAKGVNLTPGGPPASSYKNYDQVYSYNKPYKNLKNPIPLIPLNEFCKRPNITAPMTAEEEEDYAAFIKREASYMESQNWEEFPDKSRLFIGNLPANTISKQDLFRIFRQYGDVIQIAIKAGYGFAQFRTSEACLDCIKGETNVPLHNKIMRLDASKPQKSRKAETGNREKTDDDHQAKKFRKGAPECQIYITGKSSVFFIRKVKKAFESLQIIIDTEDVTHKELSDVISEAAYSGVVGTCVIKEHKVDVQTFESTPDGGIKFDEYADVDPEVAADLVHKCKVKRYGHQPSASPQQSFDNSNNYAPNQNFGNPSYTDAGQGGYNNNQNNNSNAYGGYGGYNNNQGQNDGSNAYGSYGQMEDRRGGYGRRGGPGGRSRQRWNQNPTQSYGYNYEPQAYNQRPQAYGGYQPQPQSQQYGNAPSYGNKPISYGSQPISYGDAPKPPPPQAQTQPKQNQSVEAGLMQTLQNMDTASVQNVISLIQQKQNQTSNSNSQPLNYGNSSGSNQPQSANTQVNSLLSQLKSTSDTGGNGDNNTNNSGPTTQSLMDTLARLSRK